MKNLNKYISLLLCSLFVFSIFGCKKVEHSIDDEIVSFNESTVSAIQIGKKLKVGFITNKVSSFDFSIQKDGASILSEKVNLEANQRIVEKEFEIPLDESYIGEGVLKVTYQSGGQTITKEHPITFEESNPQMFIVGGSTGAGWEPTNATLMSLYDEESKTKFEIYEYLTAEGGFKFLPTNVDWTGGYGKGTTDGTLLQDGEAGNITVDEDGFYQVRMDADLLTYEVLKLKIGVVGDATPTGWDSDTKMNFEGGKGTYVWKITINLVPGKFKFRANDDWDIDFGGTESEIIFKGPDIEVTSAGTYDISLDLTPGAYKASIQKK